MRFKSRKKTPENYPHLMEWHRWFAWYPVNIKGTWIWWENIYRKGTYDTYSGRPYWEYNLEGQL